MKRTLLALLLVAATVSAARLQYADRFSVVSPSDPQISPDGKTIAFVTSRANLKENRYDTDLQLVDLASGVVRPLTFERRGVAQPRWSPDGSAIAFLAISDGKRQLWVMPTTGGDPRRVTDSPSACLLYT